MFRFLKRAFLAVERFHNRLVHKLERYIWKILGWECYAPKPKPSAKRVRLRVTIPSIRFSFKGEKMSFVLRNDQAVEFRPEFIDDFGNVADELGSKPTWSLTDDSIGTLTVSEDGLSAVFVPSGKKGVTRVDLIVDADPDAEVEVPLLAYADITVLSGMARTIRLQGTLIAKPVEPPVETPEPTVEPTEAPTAPPETEVPTEAPTAPPETEAPTEVPEPTEAPVDPTDAPTEQPTQEPGTDNPPANTLITTSCDGVNLVGTYADGNGGTVTRAIEVNSTSCGGTGEIV